MLFALESIKFNGSINFWTKKNNSHLITSFLIFFNSGEAPNIARYLIIFKRSKIFLSSHKSYLTASCNAELPFMTSILLGLAPKLSNKKTISKYPLIEALIRALVQFCDKTGLKLRMTLKASLVKI